MRNASVFAFVFALMAIACASAPKPTQKLAEAQGALRAADEVGAANVPQAQLYSRLAEDQMVRAQKLMEDDENEKAAGMLDRATADAELALALSRRAKVEQNWQ
jgi:hypothetical protein